jgi:hypothetical protein
MPDDECSVLQSMKGMHISAAKAQQEAMSSAVTVSDASWSINSKGRRNEKT